MFTAGEKSLNAQNLVSSAKATINIAQFMHDEKDVKNIKVLRKKEGL